MQNIKLISRFAPLFIIVIMLGIGHAASAAEKSTKKKRDPIYNEKADAKADIAASVAKAKRENKRVLIEFGGNGCGWCYKLYDLFHENKEVSRLLRAEYELVLVDIGVNRDLAYDIYKIERGKGVPYLTVLDGDGKIVKNQNTADLEKGRLHDPPKVLAFLDKWKAEPLDAERLLSQALAKANANGKNVFLTLGAPWCGWCRRFEEFLHRQDIANILERDFILLKIDLQRMTNADPVQQRFRKTEGGIPWFAFLNAKGKILISSDGPDGNIGCPGTESEIAHFKHMLTKTAKNITAHQIGHLVSTLQDQAQARRNQRKPS